jgi:hypothetical protein
VVREATALSGTQFDDETGTVKLSEAQEQRLRQKHGAIISTIVNRGIPLTAHVGYKEWGEIFSNDPPAGRYAVEAHDDETFERLRFEALEARIPISNESADEEGVDEACDTQEVATQDDEISVQESLIDRVILGTPQPSPAWSSGQSSSLTASTPVPSRFGPNQALNGLRGRRSVGMRSRSSRPVRKEADLTEALTALVRVHTAALGASGSRSSPRVPGAEDLEKAIQSYVEFTRYRSNISTQELIKIMQEDVTNPIVWNALQDSDQRLG